MPAIQYKGILKEALEMNGVFFKDDGEYDHDRVERWKEMKLPSEYGHKPNYDLIKDSYREFI